MINYDIVDFWLRNGFHLCILFHWKIDPLNSSNARIINFLRDFISKLGDDQSPDTQNTISSRKSSEHTLIRDSNGNVLHPHMLTLSGYNNYCKDLGRFVLCSWRAHYRVLNFLLQRAAISKTINDLRVFWFSTRSPSSLFSYNIHSVYQQKNKFKIKFHPGLHPQYHHDRFAMKILKLPITTTMRVCSKEVYTGPKLMMSYGTRTNKVCKL